MEIVKDINLFEWLKNEAWAGAKRIAPYFKIEEIDYLEEIIKELFEVVPTETQINDLFWFDTEMLLETLGIEQEEFDKREKQW